ncbi:hypothetical protein BGX28_002508 [Mortierella sp. GBA30]|nr:hypothetical protein BGX28_002508 [Mortierella sp. GBA30]
MPSNSTCVPPLLPTEGRLGYLTLEQSEKLKQFWARLYDVFDGKAPFDQTAPSSFKGQAREDDKEYSPAPTQKTWWFGRSKSASESSSGPVAPRFTVEELHQAFWKLTMMDHPDMIDN